MAEKKSNFPPHMAAGFEFSRLRQRELGLTKPGSDPAAMQRALGHVQGFLTGLRLLEMETTVQWPTPFAEFAPVTLKG